MRQALIGFMLVVFFVAAAITFESAMHRVADTPSTNELLRRSMAQTDEALALAAQNLETAKKFQAIANQNLRTAERCNQALLSVGAK